jgi:squalene-associated FAD-dependent desaturase
LGLGVNEDGQLQVADGGSQNSAAQPHPNPSVIIIGAGLASLAAASALAPRGFAVMVLESRNRLGGRASSFTDAATGQLVDACQHVSMGCCTNFAHFCRTTGIDHFLAPQPTLYFMTPDRRISRFKADPLPAPFHLSRALLRAHYLTFGDKLRIAWGLLAIRRADPEDDEPLLPWLQRHRQNDHTIQRFWSVVLTSALNESIERLGLKYARKVFRDGFLAHRKGFEVSVPTVPLARLYGDELQAWFAKHRVRIEMNAGVKRILFAPTGDGRETRVQGVELRDGKALDADWYVAAVPFDRLLDLLPAAIVERSDCFRNLRQLEVSPITSVHLWFDRPMLDLPHVVLIDSLGQWVFNRGESALGEHYVQIVVSASRLLRSWGHEEIQRRVVEELEQLFPAAKSANLRRGRVVTEHSATFSAVPGVDRARPGQQSPISNLLLAGDWTRSGWPATMEGAVRSGYLAAECILRQMGREEKLVQPDLGFRAGA